MTNLNDYWRKCIKSVELMAFQFLPYRDVAITPCCLYKQLIIPFYSFLSNQSCDS